MCGERWLLGETQVSQYRSRKTSQSSLAYLEILATELNDGYTYRPVGQTLREDLAFVRVGFTPLIHRNHGK